MTGVQLSREKTTDPNLQKSPQKINDLVFFGGLVISCFAEIALIGYATNLPHLYYRGFIGAGLDFNVALMLLIIGNLILFAEYKLKKSQ